MQIPPQYELVELLFLSEAADHGLPDEIGSGHDPLVLKIVGQLVEEGFLAGFVTRNFRGEASDVAFAQITHIGRQRLKRLRKSWGRFYSQIDTGVRWLSEPLWDCAPIQ